MDGKRNLFYRAAGYFLIALLLFLFFAWQVWGGKGKPGIEKEISFPVMGTIAHLKIQGEKGMSPQKVEEALSAMQKVIRTLEKECNIYDPASPLSRLNQTAHAVPVTVSGELWKLLQGSRKFYAFSEGSFDITISPLMRVWGFHRKRNSFPGEKEIREAKKFVGLAKIRFDETKKSVAFPSPMFRLDLGGIAKGYALDLARRKAEEMGICRGVLNLGGNILTLPRPYYGRLTYRIGIRDPRQKGETLAVIDMPPGRSIATSGSYERFRIIGGKKVSHIIDPLSGYPVSHSLSATVLTEKGIDSDALSTTLFVKGEECIEKILREFPGTQILYFREEKGKMKGFARGKAFEKVSWKE